MQAQVGVVNRRGEYKHSLHREAKGFHHTRRLLLGACAE